MDTPFRIRRYICKHVGSHYNRINCWGWYWQYQLGLSSRTIIKQSLNNGREGGFSFIAGVWLSDIVLIVLSNVFSELVTHLMTYSKLLGIIGSIFLISMGVFYIFFKKIKIQGQEGGLLKFRQGSDGQHILIRIFY